MEPVLDKKARAYFYKVLSECYYPPDEKLIKRLNSLDELVGGPSLELLKAAPETGELEALKVDFSRLFVGPFKVLAPPYGSVYLEGSRTVMGNSTIDVRKRYKEEKLDISLKEAPDHVAIELEFMYYLIFKEMEAGGYLEKQEDFLKTHLGAWISEFTDNVEANAKSDFYKNLARLTKSFVEKDLKDLVCK